MKRFKVNLLISDEDISINAIQRQHSSCQDITLLQHRFLRHAIYLAHIEGFLVELVNDHLIYTLLEVIVALLF